MARSRSAVTGTHLEVDGLRESMKELKLMDARLPKVVSKASRDLVKTVMTPPAQSKWASQDIKPSVAKKVIKGSGTTTGASLKLMYASFPYAAGVEYGSKFYSQFRKWRGNQFTYTNAAGSSTGYVVQDTIREQLPEFGAKWEKAVSDAILKARRDAGV